MALGKRGRAYPPLPVTATAWWKGAVLAATTGVAAGFALTVEASPLLGLFAWAPLFLALDGEKTVRAFVQGCAAGLLMTLISTSFVLSSAAAYFGSLAVGLLAWTAGALLVSVGVGLGCALGCKLGRAQQQEPLLAALALTALERAWPQPLPYPFGMTLVTCGPLARGAAVFGVSGLSLAVFLVGAATASLARRLRYRGATPSPKAEFAAVLALTSLLVAGSFAPSPATGSSPLRVRLAGSTNPAREASASNPANSEPHRLDLLVLPESTFEQTLAAEDLGPLIEALLGPERPAVLVGSTVRDDGRSYNRALLLPQNAAATSSYDKRQLLPFAERRWLFASSADYTPGATSAAMSVEGAPFATSVCYESLFGEQTRADLQSSGGTFLVNLANDGWFNDARPIEAQIRALQLRAIENGVPVVRAARDGVSVAIAADGTVLSRSPRGANLEIELRPQVAGTAYARFGDGPLVAAMLLLAAMVLLGWRLRARTAERRQPSVGQAGVL